MPELPTLCYFFIHVSLARACSVWGASAPWLPGFVRALGYGGTVLGLRDVLPSRLVRPYKPLLTGCPRLRSKHVLPRQLG